MTKGFNKYDPEGKRFDFRNPQSRVAKEKEQREQLEKKYDTNVWNLLNQQTREFNIQRKLAIVSPEVDRRYRPYNPIRRRPLLVYNTDSEESEQTTTPAKPTDITKRKLRLD